MSSLEQCAGTGLIEQLEPRVLLSGSLEPVSMVLTPTLDASILHGAITVVSDRQNSSTQQLWQSNAEPSPYSYWNGTSQVQLDIIAFTLAVELNVGYEQSALDTLLTGDGVLAGCSLLGWKTPQMAILDLGNSENWTYDALPSALANAPQVHWISPVFVAGSGGFSLIASDEVIVCLKAGESPETVLPVTKNGYHSFLGSSSIFILSVDGGWSDTIATANALQQNPQVAYAEPNFLSDVSPDPVPLYAQMTDPLYAGQWHLNNTGQTGAASDADVDAPEAWSSFTGSDDIVIAILDDGVETTHPDLAANMFYNEAEVNGVAGDDDDDNGYKDDFCGWDFVTTPTTPLGDNDPNPSFASDNHGTAVAGVAAAVGDNALGATGISKNSRILPVRISGSLSYSELAAAVYYAGGVDANGDTTWRGADIINFSWRWSESSLVTAAFDTVAEYGRGGLGTAVFAASGNDAKGHYRYSFGTGSLPNGEYILQWEYAKDPADIAGEDTVWLSNVVLPTSTPTNVRFDQSGLPTGWATGGDANWSVVDDPSHAYGVGRYEAKAGTIGNSQSTILQSAAFTLTPGQPITFDAWTSSEKGTTTVSYPPDGDDGDCLFLWLNNTTTSQWFGSFVDAGTQGNRRSDDPEDPPHTLHIPVAYPANLDSVIAVGASTDWDYRADYSQYGSDLDFVAPSSGGFAGITTTDRTGDDGYNQTGSGDGDSLADTNYMSTFGGTSSASPLAAGIAALMLSKQPGLTAEEIRGAMQDSADQIGGVTYTNGFNSYYGHGRINAEAALDMISDAPTSVDLLATSDTGVYYDDEITKLDNSDNDNKLDFDVAGTVSGATVTLYAGDTEIGWKIATGDTTTITTNGTVDLSDDQEPYSVHTITARQTVPGKLPSVASSGLEITVDVVAPTVEAFARYYDDGDWELRPTTLDTITITFSEDVYDEYSDSLSLYNISTLQPQAPTYTFSGQETDEFTWDFDANLTSNPGWYSVTISGDVTDLAGNSLDGDGDGTGGDDYVYGVSSPEDDMLIPILGDADLDGAVDWDDLQILMGNFGGPDKTWSEADFNYDGWVDSYDYITIKQNIGMSLSR